MVVLWLTALVVVGLVGLTWASDLFVDGAVSLSRVLGVSPVVIGAIVIGLGTSAPELLVSVLAAASGDAALGVGNVVGSNVANLSLVLGSAAIVSPLVIPRHVLRREAPLSFLAVVLFAVLLRDGLTLLDGVILLGALVAALVAILRYPVATAPDEPPPPSAEELEDVREVPERRVALRTLVGLVGTVLGAQLLVEGATGLAAELGVSAGFIGVTLVAVGTSLPELVTSIQASRKGHHDLIVGNVLGSNLFNSLAVGGAIGLFAPGDIGDPQLTGRGNLVMVVVAAAALLMMWQRRRVVRVEGVLLLAGYAATVLVMR